MKPGDLAVVTGPLVVEGQERVYLEPNEVVRVLEWNSQHSQGGSVRVLGMNSNLDQYIDETSLTPLTVIQDDPTVGWGDLLDPNYVHDYVWEDE